MADVDGSVSQSDTFWLIEFLHAINGRTAADSNLAAIFSNARIRGNNFRIHREVKIYYVAGSPGTANCQILSRLGSGLCRSIHCSGCIRCPSRNSRVQRELLGLCDRDRKFDRAIPRIVCFLLDLEPASVLKVPIESGIVIQMHIYAVLAGAVEISGQGRERTLDVRWAAGYVVPGIPNIRAAAKSVKMCGIKCQRIAIAIGRSIERHSGVDSVVQCAFDHVGELRLAARGQHAPVPHHVADCGAAFAISLRVGQLIWSTECLPLCPRANTAG